MADLVLCDKVVDTNLKILVKSDPEFLQGVSSPIMIIKKI